MKEVSGPIIAIALVLCAVFVPVMFLAGQTGLLFRELAGAMIAAIALTLRQRKDSKYVSPSDQVRVKAKDRMVVVKMEATQAAVVTEAGAATPEENKK